MAKKLSIIIPAHNAQAYIEKTMKTVLAQKCQSQLEIIVVDDASQDKTKELVKKFPVELIELSQNLGAGKARNQGAKKATGEILVFLDADVYLEPGALAMIEQFFEKNPSASGLVGNYTQLPADKNFCSVYHNLFTVYHHQLSESQIKWFWGAMSAIRKEVFEQVGGFPENFPGASAEDIELGFRITKAGYKIFYLPELKGVHAHYFTLRSMLSNDWRKAVLGLKVYFQRKSRGERTHGFFHPLNGINIFLIYLQWLSLLGLSFFWQPSFLLLLVLFFIINYRFYQYIAQQAGWLYSFGSLILHWLAFNAIAGGVIAGFIGLILGKDLESKSRWI